MKEEEAGLIPAQPGRKANKPKDIKRRFYECQLRCKKIKNRNAILYKQYENEIDLDLNLRMEIQSHCEYLKKEVLAIIDELEDISIDYPDAVTNAKLRDILKKTKKQIEKSRQITNGIMKRVSAPFFFKDNEIHYPDKITTRSAQACNKERPQAKRSAYPQPVKEAFRSGASNVEIDSEKVETNKDEIVKFIDSTHNKAFEKYKTLHDRIGRDAEYSEMPGGNRHRRDNKISKTCYAIVIAMIVVVVIGSGVAIYLLFE